jgi:uncharacterized protein YecE (DUF72 family)
MARRNDKEKRGGMDRPPARIGTSGWSYPGWRHDFYAGVPQRNWLAFCAAHFTGIEVNATFYREMKPSTLARWRDETPADFVFAIKGHRFITHVKRLADPADSVARQHRAVAALGDKLAVMLWQLPGTFGKNMARLHEFLGSLDAWPEVRHAVEFRDTSWFDDEVAAALARHRAAVCISDAADWPMWEAVTTDLVYVRLHGHERTYASAYSDKQLRSWARRARRWLTEARAVHVYFDNDSEGAAPCDAMRLLGMLSGQKAAAPTSN